LTEFERNGAEEEADWRRDVVRPFAASVTQQGGWDVWLWPFTNLWVGPPMSLENHFHHIHFLSSNFRQKVGWIPIRNLHHNGRHELPKPIFKLQVLKIQQGARHAKLQSLHLPH
jgi:hypothetical protein